jgi:hypothetical protein
LFGLVTFVLSSRCLLFLAIPHSSILFVGANVRMFLIEHRVNTVEKLRRVPLDRGIEVDVRDYDGTLRCVHDPLLTGSPLEELLADFKHRFVIFNVKCDGLERQIETLAASHNIEEYFFLDVANPSLVQYVGRGGRRVAVRFSEYEPIEFALAFRGQAEWVWIDCFTHLPLDPVSYGLLKQHFKICLVSPELQQHSRSKIQDFRQQLVGMEVDAVCTDYCSDWM